MPSLGVLLGGGVGVPLIGGKATPPPPPPPQAASAAEIARGNSQRVRGAACVEGVGRIGKAVRFLLSVEGGERPARKKSATKALRTGQATRLGRTRYSAVNER
ncbi:hypothetical protein FQZ97_1029160 [compost metagenome]